MTRLHVTRRATDRIGSGLDDRLTIAGLARKQSSHMFPKHFSFFWGEIALYSFIVLLLSGTVLALHFVPDTADTVYTGDYTFARGMHMSRAYESVLNISFDWRGGLFIRQVHHWAAHLFIASMVLHMLRNYFTGAFRRPRELTWITGVLLLMIAVVEGYSGYSMVDDLLSGMGVRIISGLVLSVPVIGTWLHWMIFQSEWEGTIWISRFFLAHVFLLPAILFALIALHVGLVWFQKHTTYPGRGRTETNYIGERAVPGFGVKTISNGIGVMGILLLIGGVVQINPVFLWGPYVAANGSTGAEPDWYAQFIIGALRIFPRADIDIGIYTVPAPLWPGLVLPLLMFVLLAAYPFLERWVTKDRALHNLLQRPRDNPHRTALGAMAVTFWAVLTIAGGDDIAAIAFDLPLQGVRWAGRIGVLVLPGIAYFVTYRVCIRLQRRDRDLITRGLHTGILQEGPRGVYVELRQPPGGVDAEGRPIPTSYNGMRVDDQIGVRDGEPT